MELGAGESFATDHCSNGTTIICNRNHVALVGCIEVIAVHEIGMQSPRADRDPFEQGVLFRRAQCVPSHVGNSQGRIGRSDAVDLALDPTQPRSNFIFATPLGHQLHAYADAEEGATSSAYALV